MSSNSAELAELIFWNVKVENRTPNKLTRMEKQICLTPDFERHERSKRMKIGNDRSYMRLIMLRSE